MFHRVWIPDMTARSVAYATLRLCAAMLGLILAGDLALGADPLPVAEKNKIEALIEHIENLRDATFVRNDRSYDAKTAARFMRGKWEANKADIKSARDFVDKVASVSSTTGKPYLIRFKDGKEVKSGTYLLQVLEKMEKKQRP